MSWDDEEWDGGGKDAAPVAAGNWDDEDVDDEPIAGDDWDAEPTAKDEVTKVVPGEKKLTKRQLLVQKEERDKAERLKMDELNERMKNDPNARGLNAEQIRKAQEASELSLAMDAFGGDDIEAPVGGEFKNEQLDLDNVDIQGAAMSVETLAIVKKDNLEEHELKNVADYKKFAEKVSRIVTKNGNTKMLLAFLEGSLEEVTKNMKLDDANLVKNKINTICALKQKTEAGKKKKANTKAALGGGSSKTGKSSGYDDMGGGGGGMYDDYM